MNNNTEIDAIIRNLVTGAGPVDVTNADIVNAYRKGGPAEKIARREKAAQMIKTLKAVGNNKKQIIAALVNSGYKTREARASYRDQN